jgi:hypothetical protein
MEIRIIDGIKHTSRMYSFRTVCMYNNLHIKLNQIVQFFNIAGLKIPTIFDYKLPQSTNRV